MIGQRMVTALSIVVSSLLVSGVSVKDTDSVDRIRVTVTVGKSVELSCRKAGREKAIVAEWKYRKSHGLSAFRVSLNRYVMRHFRPRFSVRSANDSSDDEQDFSLVISPVIRTDMGVYSCCITDQSSELLRFVHLEVTEPAMLQKAVVGSDAILPCICTSTFLNPVKWTHRDNVTGSIATVVEEGRVKLERFSVKNGSHLVISNVSHADHGIYLCIEDDGFGAKHPVFLFVLEDADENSSVPLQKFLAEFNNSVEFEVNESPDVHPLTLPVLGTNRPPVQQNGDEDMELSSDDSSLLEESAQPQQQQRSRQRLYGVSREDVNDVVQSFNVEHHAASPVSRALSLPASSSDQGTVERQPPVASGTVTAPIAGMTSHDIPGTVADSRLEVEPRFQPFPGSGADAAAVGPQPQAAPPMIVVHATVERQPSGSRTS